MTMFFAVAGAQAGCRDVHNAGMTFPSHSPAAALGCLSAVLFLLGLTGCADQEPAACASLNASIDRHLVSAALLQHEGEMEDRSAAQQSARVGLIQNHLINIQTQVSLMAQHACAPRPAPVDPAAYADASRNCYLSSLSASTSKLQDRPENERQAIRQNALAACEFSRWQAR
jgi:hypothetical protein